MTDTRREPQARRSENGGWRDGRGSDAPVGASSHLTPQNLEAEEAVLGALLMSARAIEIATDLGLRADDFYRPSHRIIYEAIRELATRDAVDELTVVNELRRAGTLEQVGGPVAVVSLAERVPAVANAKAYVEEVIQQATLRRLVETGHQIARLGYEHPEEPDKLVDLAGTMVTDLAETRQASDFVDIVNLVGPIYDELSERAEQGGKPTGLPTGFIDFDKVTGGFQDGNLIIVAARPAMGKTSWALNVVEHVGLREKRAVAVFSLEMTADDLATRMMCSLARVDMKRIRNDVPHDSDWPLLVDAAGKLTQARGKIHIDQSSSLTPMELRSKVRRKHQELRAEGGLGLVVVDYLQLMDGGKRFDSRQNEVAYISRQLKTLALELEIPVIALSQLSRANESRNDKKPMLSDLRDSGAIEQDADLVLFLHRPEYYDKDNPELQGKAEVIVAKHRNGETGSVLLGFLARYTKFVNLERHHVGPPPAHGGSGRGMPPPSGNGGGFEPGQPWDRGGGGGYGGPPPPDVV